MLIIQTAVASARKKDTVVVGDDTDLLTMLVHHAEDAHELFFAQKPKQTTQKPRIWSLKFSLNIFYSDKTQERP